MTEGAMTKERVKWTLAAIVGGVFLLCSVIAFIFPIIIGSDGKTFLEWGHEMVDHGIPSFYALSRNTDYPPITLLIIYAVVWFSRLVHAPVLLEYYFLDIIPILSICAGVVLFYLLARHFGLKERLSLWLAGAYGFMPALLLNVAIIQFDTTLAMFVLLALWLYVKERYLSVIIVSGVATLTKLHFAYFIFPLLFVAVCYQMFKRHRIGRLCLFCGIVGVVGLGLYAPFVINEFARGNYFYLFDAISRPLLKRNIFSMNAFNTLFITSLTTFQKDTFIPSWYPFVNFVIFFMIISATIYLFFKNPSDKNMLMLTAFNNLALYMITTSMYDRYLIPVLAALLLAGYVYNSRKIKFVAYYFYIVVPINIVLRSLNLQASTMWYYVVVGSVFGVMSTIVFFYLVHTIVSMAFVKGGEK